VSSATPLGAISRNNEGVHLMQNKESYKAYQKFIEGLSKAPFDPALHMNLGLSFETNEEFDKALKEYELVARDENMPNEMRFQASFNAARMKTQLKDIPGALKHYQAALDVKPDSQEAKTNIELLWQGGGGGGQGDNKDNKDQNQDNKDQKDQKDQKDNKDQNKDQKDQQQQQQKPQSQKFESKELSQQDVQKILEEIKNQEQQIRAEFDKKNQREVPRDKNW